MGELKSYGEVAGFEVYDQVEARRVLDERQGARVRLMDWRLELSHVALALLEDVAGAPQLRRRGVLLAYAAVGRRLAVIPAPASCPPEKRVELRVNERRGTGEEDWPAWVHAAGFMALHRFGNSVPSGVVAELVDGMLVSKVTALRL